jgi:hypothetical protein
VDSGDSHSHREQFVMANGIRAHASETREFADAQIGGGIPTHGEILPLGTRSKVNSFLQAANANA